MGGEEFRVSELPESLWRDLQARAHPTDAPLPAWYRRYYGTLWAVVAERQPRRVVELGVRAGYSAFVMLAASDCVVYGIDSDADERIENTHGGLSGMFRHALMHLPRNRFIFERKNTRDIMRLPPCDLVYIDAEHTREGVMHDLELAAACAPAILCDDYDSTDGVREAIDGFVGSHKEWRAGYYGDCGATLPGFILLLKQ